MNKEQVLGIVRHLLTAFGTVAIFKGWIDEQSLVLISGSIITTIGGIWSIIDKTPANIIEKAEKIKQSLSAKK